MGQPLDVVYTGLSPYLRVPAGWSFATILKARRDRFGGIPRFDNKLSTLMDQQACDSEMGSSAITASGITELE